MGTIANLSDLLEHTARTHPQSLALIDPDYGNLTYSQLFESASDLANTLAMMGLSKGDRVGVCASKSAGVICAVHGILAAGCAYVPVDYNAPAARSGFIFADCQIAAMVVAANRFDALRDELKQYDCEVVGTVMMGGSGIQDLFVIRCRARVAVSLTQQAPSDLAYILYTSGSTGRPKGVMHSHATAFSFINWCSSEFSPKEKDRFSSHAPLHFDLSIFDLFVSTKHGAALLIINEERGKQPLSLASLIEDYRLTIWYSTPSILRLIVEYGKPNGRDYSALRLVLYAGEVFPPKHQRALRKIIPHPSYYNLYGPTETNVCTFDRVDRVASEDGLSMLPIGWACSGDKTRVIDPDGKDVPEGDEGELIVAGGSVMLGYWNLPEQNALAFLVDDTGERWYRTGDLVRAELPGYYVFLGRRDRMVKRRGYRIELGEIEAALHRHEFVTEAAAISVPDAESGVLIKAFINWTGQSRPSLVELKSFAAHNLPAYMIPDRFTVLDSLPKTSTDKIDYQTLKDQ